MRLGIVGVGRIGSMHARNAVSLGRVSELLLFDTLPGRAAEVARRVGPPARDAETLDALLSQSDGALIATPTDLHPKTVRRCLNARVPVLCEKPIATELGEMNRLIEEIDRSRVEVLVAFQRRFDPPTVELHRRLRAGEVGTVYLVRALGLDAEIPHLSYIPTSGGIHRDLLIHDLDAVPWLMGEPVVEVYSSGSVLVHEAFAEAGDVDNTMVMLRFASGAHAVLSGARQNGLGYDCRIEVFGSKDCLAVGLGPRTPLTSLEPAGPRVQPDAYPGFPERFHDAYVNELKVFENVLMNGAPNPSPARQSVVSLTLADACEESRRTCSPVRLEW